VTKSFSHVVIYLPNSTSDKWGKIAKSHTKCDCNWFGINFADGQKERRHCYPPRIEPTFCLDLDIFSLSSYNFLDFLVQMFWLVLISYVGSPKLLVDSI